MRQTYSMRRNHATGSTGSALAYFFLLLGVIIMLTPLKSIDTHLKKAAPLEAASGLTATDFQAGGSYDLGEVMVLDNYAYATTNDDINTNYYAVLFGGDNDEPYLISVAVSTGDDIYQELWDYSTDETLMLGDLTKRICGVAQEFEDDTLSEYYQGYQDDLYNEGIEVTAIPLELIYKGQDADAFQKSVNRDWAHAVVTTVIIELVGILFLIIGILLKRHETNKPKKKEAEMDGPKIL